MSEILPPYQKPKVRLSGVGGAPEIAASAKEVLIILRQILKAFVYKLDFVTSIGHGEGFDHHERLGGLALVPKGRQR
jgi:glutaconate CoA-transferase subunit B